MFFFLLHGLAYCLVVRMMNLSKQTDTQGDTAMTTLTITSDHKWKQFKCRHEVPKAILTGQFDYLDEDADGFINYRGHWYHTSCFMSGGPEGWHGYHGDSYYSGVVIKLSQDGEEYMIGTAIW